MDLRRVGVERVLRAALLTERQERDELAPAQLIPGEVGRNLIEPRAYGRMISKLVRRAHTVNERVVHQIGRPLAIAQ